MRSITRAVGRFRLQRGVGVFRCMTVLVQCLTNPALRSVITSLPRGDVGHGEAGMRLNLNGVVQGFRWDLGA